MPKKNEYTISLKQEGPAARETSRSIEEQISAFLESGGQIDQIPSGVSGQISLGEKARLAREEQQKKEDMKDAENQPAETSASETSASETSAPETSVPETSASETSVPETSASKTSESEKE